VSDLSKAYQNMLTEVLHLYFARLLRPVWHLDLFDCSGIRSREVVDLDQVIENLTLVSINLLLEKLTAFIEFMMGFEQNILGRSEKGGFDKSTLVISQRQIVAKLVEKTQKVNSYGTYLSKLLNERLPSGQIEERETQESEVKTRGELYRLASRTLEILRFYRVIVQHKRNFRRFSVGQVRQLSRMKFSDLVLHPNSNDILNRFLICSFMYLPKEALEGVLRQAIVEMPSFFSKADSTIVDLLQK
jgi:hypothetical protein